MLLSHLNDVWKEPKETFKVLLISCLRVSHISASLLALCFVIAVFQFELDGLKGMLVDLQFRLSPWKKPHPGLVLVEYSDSSSNFRHREHGKIPLADLTALLQSFASAKPKAIGILADISPKTYSDSELALIVKHIEENPNTIIGYIEEESYNRLIPPALLSVAKVTPGFISRDTFSYGADSVSRRVMITLEGVPTFYSELAQIYRGESKPLPFRGSHRYGEGGNSLQTYISWQGRSGTYVPHSTQDVIAGRVDPKVFKDNIILLSTHLHSKGGVDHVLTPYSRDPSQTSALEGAAHSLATLMGDSGIIKCPQWIILILSLILTVITANIVLSLPPGRGVIFALGEMVSLFILSWLALHVVHIWIDLAHPFVVICFGYYLVIPYRLVDEYRKRWHYQEKSEMMTELEQLKTNFLSFISHDLKTPIARIQGNAELLLTEAKAITAKQKKSLSTIIHTSEDLSKYVETILDLTRIESAKVPILKTTKDINSTILEVVESRSFMAKEKDIIVSTKLDPIFSFKFDVNLIKRVFQNLLENAIKYSPAGTEITWVSKEDSNWVRVSIEDKGIGIKPEDQEKVFTKFYRCDNSTTEEVKGTGLGLYLVKYFVELHQGNIKLRSSPAMGSVFTVSLPVIT